MILAIKTNQPQATLALVEGAQTLEQYDWLADRQLAATLLVEIKQLLQRHKLEWEDLTGLIVYRGPGSFTGLRIGVTVANTIAYAQQLPIVGTTGDNWVADGVKQLKSAQPGGQVVPEYGAEPNISKPRK